jgi:hypothetical protein
LKLDWDYIFHPERINQCKPRQLKNDEPGGAPESVTH